MLHSRIAARMIQEVREAKRKMPPAFAELTPRELEVLQLLADGQTNAAIAEQLVLSGVFLLAGCTVQEGM